MEALAGVPYPLAFHLLLIVLGAVVAIGVPVLVASISWPGVLGEMTRPRRTGLAVGWP
jgi:uncharacterized membrane protein